MERKPSDEEKYFFARVNGKFIKINISDILYIQGCKNYIKLSTVHKVYYILLTMKAINLTLSKSGFLRIHKSYIVALDKITEFNSFTVSINDIRLPIGASFKEQLKKAVPLLSY